eukprot:CAMPEP_0204638444 /NCGR_PEP_ID=MMETSP0717-20131115/39562_1 /ASSEMBLY_ACC=CAM_ASM_000666 /TAXON_ID=230516 /ORGANISM="Chaetoceros curvisetus" /LENGTH=91 /DNA_ID=CAMNT_0051658229 /DNA_START=90 /DNA_END=362 /DNA_ORIENTATION=-
MRSAKDGKPPATEIIEVDLAPGPSSSSDDSSLSLRKRPSAPPPRRRQPLADSDNDQLFDSDDDNSSIMDETKNINEEFDYEFSAESHDEED